MYRLANMLICLHFDWFVWTAQEHWSGAGTTKTQGSVHKVCS
jgi:hypothetical protein